MCCPRSSPELNATKDTESNAAHSYPPKFNVGTRTEKTICARQMPVRRVGLASKFVHRPVFNTTSYFAQLLAVAVPIPPHPARIILYKWSQLQDRSLLRCFIRIPNFIIMFEQYKPQSTEWSKRPFVSDTRKRPYFDQKPFFHIRPTIELQTLIRVGSRAPAPQNLRWEMADTN
jgi:hypothetical protein